MNLKRLLCVLGLALAALDSAAAGGTQAAGEPPVVYASVGPQADLVRRIAGDAFEVRTLIRPGMDVHNYDPNPREIEALSRASIYFFTGLEFERSILAALELAPVRLVDLRQGVALRTMASHDHEDQSAGRPEVDPHIWLGFDQVRAQVRTIAASLAETFPDRSQELWARHDRLLGEVAELETEIRGRLSDARGKAVLVYHPSFGYFTDDLGIEQVAVEFQGREPTTRQLTETIEDARAHGISVVATQPEYDGTSARAIANALGGRTVVLRDLGADWFVLMRDISEVLAEALGP